MTTYDPSAEQSKALTVADPDSSALITGANHSAREASVQNRLETVKHLLQQPEATLKMRRGGQPHLYADTWRSIGGYFGVFADTTGGEWVSDPITNSPAYRAHVVARYRGQVIAGATGVCSAGETLERKVDGESVRPRDQMFQVEGMAQTRATARALRNAVGFLVSLAGYSTTPAEEMPDDDDDVAPANAPAPRRGRRTAPAPAPAAEPIEAKVTETKDSSKADLPWSEGGPPAEDDLAFEDPAAPPQMQHPQFPLDEGSPAAWKATHHFYTGMVTQKLMPHLTIEEWPQVRDRLIKMATEVPIDAQKALIAQLREEPHGDNPEGVKTWLGILPDA